MPNLFGRIRRSVGERPFRFFTVAAAVAIVVGTVVLVLLLRNPEVMQKLLPRNIGLWILIALLIVALAYKQFRTNVLAGILLAIPLFTTVFIVIKAFTWVDSALPTLINRDWGVGFGAAVIVAVAYFIGVFAKNFLGQKFIQLGNAIIAKIPIMNKVYVGMQQILDAAIKGNKKLFERPVLIEYPKERCYSIGFVTARTTGEIPQKVNSPMLSIFIPTTPNPTSGFLLFLPEAEVIDLNMSVETAIKLIMSAGMINADQLSETQHLYTLPTSLKGWNWFKGLRRHHDRDDSPSSEAPQDPRPAASAEEPRPPEQPQPPQQ